MLEFDTDLIRKNRIELLDCQVDLILKSLEMYRYMYQFIYPRTKKNLTNEENLRISLITDTFNQIMEQFNNSKDLDQIISKKKNKNFKKFA